MVQGHDSIERAEAEIARVEAVLAFIFPSDALPPLCVLYSLWGWLDSSLTAAAAVYEPPRQPPPAAASAAAAARGAGPGAGAPTAWLRTFGDTRGLRDTAALDALVYDVADVRGFGAGAAAEDEGLPGVAGAVGAAAGGPDGDALEGFEAFGVKEVAQTRAPVATLMHHMVCHTARCHAHIHAAHATLVRRGNEVLFHQGVVSAYTVRPPQLAPSQSSQTALSRPALRIACILFDRPEWHWLKC